MKPVVATFGLTVAIVAAHYDPMSITGEWLIQAYKRVFSPLQGRDICNFSPTCSQFTRTAIHNYGLGPGVLMGADRLMRCHGFAWSYLGQYYRGIENNRLIDPVDRHVAWHTPPLSHELPSQFLRDSLATETMSACDSSLLLAERLYKATAFREAAMEFLRVRFTSPSPYIQTCAALMAGEAYLEGAEPASARRAFSTVTLPAAAGFVTYGIARTLFAEGRYADARTTLDSIRIGENEPLSKTAVKRQATLLYAWSLFREGRFKDATRLMASVDGDSTCSRLCRLGEAKIPYRSRLAATLFSTILPGAGQVYSGRTGDGIYSFLTVVGVGLVASHFAGHQSKDPDHIKLGIFGSLTAIFYAGNIYGANIAARDFNQARERELLSKIDALFTDVDLHPDYSPLVESTPSQPVTPTLN